MGTNIITPIPTTPHVAKTLAAIRRLVRTLRTSATDVERETGLSSAQSFVLQLLRIAPAESMNDLADRTMTDQSSVSVVVSRLESKKLAARTHSPTDARRTRVTITDAGRDLLDGKQPSVQTRLIRALECMHPDALLSLEHELTQLTALMGAAHEPPTFYFEDDATGSP
jgi:DNA-binding MarR family transcriptional regulator